MEYCYAVPAGDELYHYGIKGMHCGIIRYQPYKTVPRKSGKGGVYKPTTKEGKAKLWKERESERQAGRYDRKAKVIQTYIDKKSQKLKVAKLKGSSKKKIDKIKRKIDYGQVQKRINDKLKTAELKKIKDIKLEDVNKQRLKKGAYYAGQVLKSAAVKTATAAALSGAIASFSQAGKEVGKVSRAMLNAGVHAQESIDRQNAAQEAIGFANKIKIHNVNSHMGYITNNMPGNLSIRGMDSKDWMKNFADRMTEMRAAKSSVHSSLKVAAKAVAAANAMQALGFGLSTTALGSAALNFTKIGRVNEFSNLNRKERKTIINKEMDAYKKRKR